MAATGRDTGSIIRGETERAVHRVLRELHGPDAVVSRPISPELSIPAPIPADWPRGIQAALRLSRHAQGLAQRWALKARGEGASWRALAEPLGVDLTDKSISPDEAAFELVAGQPRRPFDPMSTGWDCTTCGKWVSDRGPYNGHPVDCESGHAEDCARHQAAIVAYERQRNEEG